MKAKRKKIPKGHVFCMFCFGSHPAPTFDEKSGAYIVAQCDQMKEAIHNHNMSLAAKMLAPILKGFTK
jgi:hypothetical protein